MADFIPRPYKLFNKIQHYDWGARNENAFIPKLLGIEIQPDRPYAELWIGAHPRASSEIELDGRLVPLNEIIAGHSKDSLGGYVLNKFSGAFPFLLKVLSAGRALSVQTHPNKSQAVRLHASSPENYPDDNHKPEIAVAIDSLTALTGFRPAAAIASSLRMVPELSEYVDARLFDRALAAGNSPDLEKSVSELYADIMRRAKEREKLAACIRKIRSRLSTKEMPAPEEAQFLAQYDMFGPDVGLFSFFFFNMVQLKPGQAIFTDAGVPHAYLSGNIVECMANSDNVVRAGLTNKFKDVATLLNIVKYDFAECRVINSEQKMDEVTYETKAEEFRITRFHKRQGSNRNFRSNGRPSVCLVLEGEVEVRWAEEGNDNARRFSRGESFFVPAFLSEYNVSSVISADYFVVEIP
ncbi:MAG: mannose-6-phosphate isomerase, class I [Bacteroidetes bacterium]|nr:mannose-6-phosphate isomerase, class I [Bacteroidota bacterium]